MVDKLAATRFLAVVGTSGSGKSSLVNCGLRPALHRGLMAKAGTAWRIAQFRPGSDPIRAWRRRWPSPACLFRELRASTACRRGDRRSHLAHEQAGPGRHLRAVHARMTAQPAGRGGPVRGVVPLPHCSRPPRGDQRYRRGSHRLRQPAAGSRGTPRHPIYVVLTMRSDFLGDCAQFPGLAEAINRGPVPGAAHDPRRAPRGHHRPGGCRRRRRSAPCC